MKQTLYKGDCLEVMDKLIKDGVKVDCILTDPPYNIARDNNFKTMGRSGIDFGEWDKGFDQFSWLDKIKNILTKNGSAIIFNDWKNIGEIAKYLESNGFEIKDMLRWEKTNPMPRNRDRRYITDFECAVWVTVKGAKWTFNRISDTYERPKFVYGIVSGKQKIHPTQKNVNMLEHILKIHSNENFTILDCFIGSNSTGIACLNTNRNYIGIEKDDTYFDLAVDRTQKHIQDNNIECELEIIK